MSTMKVKPLPKEFVKAPGSLKSRFVQFKRNEYGAIYQRFDPTTNELQGWEVFEIKVGKPNDFVGREGHEELYPSNTNFGRWAWAPHDECGALTIFEQITKGKGSRTVGRGEDFVEEEVPEEEEVETKPTKKSGAKAVKVKVKKTKVKKATYKTGRRGKVAADRPAIKFPSKSEWCMADLLTANKGTNWTQPTLYIALKGMKRVTESCRRKVKSGKGRPTVFYKLK